MVIVAGFFVYSLLVFPKYTNPLKHKTKTKYIKENDKVKADRKV